MIKKLSQQLEELRQQELKEKKLIEEEGVLLRQQAELQAIEEVRLHAAKLNAQKAIRAALDKCNGERIRKRQQEIKDSLDMDLKIVNEYFLADMKEKDLKNRKKDEMRKEMIEYRKHLEEMREAENLRERELEKLYKEEETKVWRIRAEKWKKEQEARDKLMLDVLAGRQEQLRFAAEQNKLKLTQNKIETENLLKEIEKSRLFEEKERLKILNFSEEYSKSLSLQILEVEEKRRLEKLKSEMEYQKQQELEKKFNELLVQETERLLMTTTSFKGFDKIFLEISKKSFSEPRSSLTVNDPEKVSFKNSSYQTTTENNNTDTLVKLGYREFKSLFLFEFIF
ncbi:hypothetical protein HK099_001955 [Clydaea vesicula]|uniref:Cilia- and flagella-associated protein 53 n=1 Tax=Clydaea vesicula TaxID=447962 RepID=A0AAD5XRU1_9FUNG|nr:hypothetical protein HK099_001955 [Clydaea vesicula]